MSFELQEDNFNDATDSKEKIWVEDNTAFTDPSQPLFELSCNAWGALRYNRNNDCDTKNI